MQTPKSIWANKFGWAEQEQFLDDVRYVRGDIAEELIAALKACVETLTWTDPAGLAVCLKATEAIAKATEVAT